MSVYFRYEPTVETYSMPWPWIISSLYLFKNSLHRTIFRQTNKVDFNENCHLPVLLMMSHRGKQLSVSMSWRNTGRVEVQILSFVTLVFVGSDGASRLGRINPGKIATGTHWIKGYDSPKADLDILVKRKMITSIRYLCKVGLSVVTFVDQN